MKKIILIGALLLVAANAIAGPSDINPAHFNAVNSSSMSDIDSD